MAITLATNDRARLREILEQRFSLEELETLAFDLGVDYNQLAHATTTQLSRELVIYFERRGNLNSLITGALSQRYDDYLMQLSAKLPFGSSRKKVQIIVTQDVQYNPSEIITDLAAKLKIDVDQVELIGAARGSLRLLVGLTQDAASVLVNSNVGTLVNGKYHVISIMAFDSLDVRDQDAWRSTVRKGIKQPISWNSVLESDSGGSQSEQPKKMRAMTQAHFGIHGLLQAYERTMLALLAFDDGDHLWRIVRRVLNGLGFYWLHHRTAVTIWRRGKFLYVLEAPDGHHWQHYWRILHEEEAGPEISLTPRLAEVSYGNLPTTLGSDRPISVSMRLMVSYLFEPQAFPDASPDFVEAQIRNSPEARDEAVRRFCRPELERLLGELNPIEVRLRYTDQVLRQVLQERLGNRLSSIAFRILMVDIEEVILPPELETEIVANLELLRQSIRNYTPADIARVVTTRMSEGMRQGNSPLAEVSIDPIIRRSMSEGTAPVIDADAGSSLKSPPPSPLQPPEPKPTETELNSKEAPPKIKRKPH